ncbi:MAG: hypothetical protein AAFQ74_07245 [Cyanobacteria bacterium J06623_4]
MKAPLRPRVKSSSVLPAAKKKTPAKQRRQDAWADWIATLEAEGEETAALLEQPHGEAEMGWLVAEEHGERVDSESKAIAIDEQIDERIDEQIDERVEPTALTVADSVFVPEVSYEMDISDGQMSAVPVLGEQIVEEQIVEEQFAEAQIAEEQTVAQQDLEEQIAEPVSSNDAGSWFASKEQAIAPPPPAETKPYSPLSAANLDTLLTAAPTTELPYRPLLESRFGQPLSHIQVHPSTPEIRTVLTELDATAANYDHRILFAEAQPSLETVVHEVVHALQTTPHSPDTAPSTDPLTPLSPDSPAEQEASQLTAKITPTLQTNGLADPASTPWIPVVVTSTLSPTAIACLRNAPPATLSPTAPPRDTFQAATKSDRPADSSSVTTASPDSAATTTTDSSAPAQTETSSIADSSTAASDDPSSQATDELETIPALEVPAPPEPGITAEDVAQRQAELDAAQAALESATDVDDKVAAYAKAPPTLKAKAYGTLGQDLETLSKSESETFQAEMPDFEAKLSGKTEELPELAVETPPAEESVSLEEKPPAPAPKPTVEPTAAPTAYTENASVLKRIFKFSEGTSPQSKAGEIGDTLSAVSTTDQTVKTSPGDAPTVPLKGESDPQRIENQVTKGRDRANKDRDTAKKKILDGPGPERVQPLVMEEKMPMEAIAPPKVERPEPVAGIDDFGQREMPAEVNTAFDLTHQQSMQESMTEAQAEVQKTTKARDDARKEKVDKAQADADKKTAAADKKQREDVHSHREQIQRDRKTALDTQNKAVKTVEKESEARQKKDRDAIDERVKTDQKTVKADYDKAEGKAKAKVKGGEKKAEDKRRQAERDAEKESWWDRAVSFVKKAIQALTDAISKIFDAVRAAVNKILDDVKKAALALIDKAANFIKKAIGEFSKFLQGAVNALLKEHFPGAAKILTDAIKKTEKLATEAVDKVATKLKKEITELVEGLRKSLNAIMDALQAGLKFVSSLIQAALSGDWNAVLKMLLEAVFKVIGVEPETFYAYIGKAQETFQKILDDPGAVVKNLLDAVKLGIQKFADNFLKHLKAGIIGWLTGALGSDLTIPTEFSLIGVLDLGRQIMGLTLQLIRRIAVRILGEENVEKIEGVIEQVKSLIEGGWSGLLKRITETLTGVKEMVLGQIKEFLVTRLILSAITKLASLFNPVGAIVQLVLTLWNIFTFLKENLQRMIGIVKTITASITDIFKGIVEKASINIEATLANLLPIAISFLANLLGLGGISARVRKIIGRLRKRIEDAIVKLIRKIASRIKNRKKRKKETKKKASGLHDQRTDAQKLSAVKKAIDAAFKLQKRSDITPIKLKEALPNIKKKYQLTSLDLVRDKENTFHVLAVINPRRTTPPKVYLNRFSLAPGGFDAHEHTIIVAATEDTSAQTVHMISRHGPDVPDEVLIGRVEVLRSRFREVRQQKIDDLQRKVDKGHASIGKAISDAESIPGLQAELRQLEAEQRAAQEEERNLEGEERTQLETLRGLKARLSQKPAEEEKNLIQGKIRDIDGSIKRLAGILQSLEKRIEKANKKIEGLRRQLISHQENQENIERKLSELRHMNTTSVDIMREQLKDWGVRNVPEKATKFYTTEIMFHAVRDALKENEKKIDDAFEENGTPKAVGARYTIRHKFKDKRLLGMGYELTSRHKIERIGATNLDQIVIVVRLINSDGRLYVVETAYPT